MILYLIQMNSIYQAFELRLKQENMSQNEAWWVLCSFQPSTVKGSNPAEDRMNK